MDLDREIILIQKSTRTLFKTFTPIHNWLRLRSRLYYAWSIKPYSKAIHWIIFILYLITIPAFVFFRNSNSAITGINYTKAEGVTCSSPTWTWENPTPTGNMIYGISSVPNTEDVDVFAVGNGGTILQYSENQSTHEIAWRSMISQTTVNLKDVTTVDHSNVWAVGESGKIFKYNGKTWTEQVSGTNQTLNSVFALSKNVVWAVGNNGVILKTTDGGSNWQNQVSGTTNSLNDIYVNDSEVAWVGGDKTVINTNDGGLTWNEVDLTSEVDVYSIIVPNQNLILIATSEGLYKKANAGTWEAVIVQIDTEIWRDIFLHPDGTIFLAGENGALPSRGSSYKSIDSGLSWTPIQPPDGDRYFDVLPLWGIASWEEETWAIGEEMYQVIDGDWAKNTVGTTQNINALAGIDSNVWAITQSRGDIYPTSRVLKFGATRAEYDSGVYSSLNDIGVSSDGSEIWIVGDDNNGVVPYGLIQRYDSVSGSRLAFDSEVNTGNLLGIALATDSSIWAVGAGGSIVRTLNANEEAIIWTSDKKGGLDNSLNDVYAVKNGTDVWAVGENGTILERLGNRDWISKTSNTTNRLNGIFGTGPDNIWVVGNGGVIRNSIDGGETWLIKDAEGISANLRSVFALDSQNIYAVGDSALGMSTILVSSDGGDSWDLITNPGGINLTGVYANASGDETNLWVAGVNGSVLKYSKPTENTATKLLMALPGQEFANGFGLEPLIVNITQRAGVDMPVTIYAVDDANLMDATNGSSIRFNSTDPNLENPSPISLGSGESCGVGNSVFKFHTPTSLSWIIHANDISGTLRQASSEGSTIIVTHGTEKKISSILPAKTNLNIGEASGSVRVSLKDEFLNDVIAADVDHTITLRTTSNGGRFAPTAQGPWTSTLDLVIYPGARDVDFYYLDYNVGTPAITLSSTGLESSTLGFNIFQDQSNRVNPLISGGTKIESIPNRLLAGSMAQIKATLFDTDGYPAKEKTLKFYSSRSKDTITNPSNPSDSSGIATGTISSNQAGRSIISTFDETDNVWLESQPSIDFYTVAPTPSVNAIEMEMPAFSATLSQITADRQKLTIGKEEANIMVTVLDTAGTPMSNMPVVLDLDEQYGETDPEFKNTNTDGVAKFVFKPRKSGRVNIGASVNQTPLAGKISLELVEESRLSALESLVDSFIGSSTAKKIADVVAPIVATTATLGLIPLIAGFVGSAPATLHAVAYGISLSLEALGIKRRRKNWGRVYNSATGKGVDLAVVRLYDQNTMKLVGTIITDPKGRYNFQPQPGTYVISVNKDGFIYPTQMFAKYGLSKINKNASKMNSHYLGQPINISSEAEFLNLDIPIDQMDEKATLLLRIRIWSEVIVEIVTHGLSHTLIPILAIGMMLSVFVQLIQPTLKNWIFAATYSIITLIYTISKMIKASHFSTIYDLKTGKPIPDVFVSIFEKQHDTLKESRITDKYGRFSIFSQPGSYYIKAEKSGYEFDPKVLRGKHLNKRSFAKEYWGESINIKSAGFVNVTILGLKKE